MSDFRVGAVFPQTEIGTDPGAIRAYAQTVEELGFDHLVVYDHVIGANIANRPNWNGPYTHLSLFHEPMVLFGFLASVTKTLVFESGVVILPQRQTVLFAKQAACVDVLSEGRLKVGVGIGWNTVEYEALGVPFADLSKRVDEQITLMRRLWTEPYLTFEGTYHKVSEAGLNPLPVQRPIPVIIGGVSPAAMKRAARIGDGWLPARMGDQQPDETVGALREAVRAAGRQPDAVPLEMMFLMGTTMGEPKRNLEATVEEMMAWRKAGAAATSISTLDCGNKTVDDHLNVLRRFAELMGLRR